MALSDACFEFRMGAKDGTQDRLTLASRLYEACEWYRVAPYDYGERLEQLQYEAQQYITDGTGWEDLLQTAERIQAELDRLPEDLM